MSEYTPNQREFIDRSWRDRWQSILQVQNQIVNWIFTVHGGGIAGLLAFAASKGSSCSVKLGLISFAGGLVLIVSYGAAMFYYESHYFYRFRDDVREFFGGTIDWPEFNRRLSRSPDKYWPCELLAWASGVLGVVGIVAAVIAIL
jgi:hypothetical protein